MQVAATLPAPCRYLRIELYARAKKLTAADNLPSLEVKALFAGHVEVQGATYYPPLLPCTTEMAAVPTISIPMPAGGTVPLPLAGVQGCNGALYSLAQPAFDNFMRLPVLSK